MFLRKNYKPVPAVLQVKQYSRDVLFSIHKTVITAIGGTRSNINRFSAESRKRLMFLLRNCSTPWIGMVTLTYPGEYVQTGYESKAHINAFLQWLRRQDIKYVWVLEFQKRGAPHYHLLIDRYLDKGLIAFRWYSIVGSGDRRHLDAGTRVDGLYSEEDRTKAMRYLFSYLKKASQKGIPASFECVGRFWGATRGLVEAVSTLVLNTSDFGAGRTTRIVRKFVASKMREWGYKYTWRNRGFTGYEASSVWNRLIESGLIKIGRSFYEPSVSCFTKLHYHLDRESSG